MATETTVQEAPIKVEAPEKGQRYSIRVFGKWCKGCGLCIAFCPREVFAEDIEHRPVVVHPERCVACQWCTIHCPDFAILVEKVNDSRGQVGK
ncbi:MAG: 4Fe-4S binding protein [Chloroflexi bacterium]|nr:4Fe-4S binding protein [Chloroflexota bacterium]